MKVSVEKLENQMAKLTVEVEPEIFENAVETVYRKQRGKISVPGFRKGKAPRQLIEKMYGSEIFFEDAADEVIRNEYPKAYDESKEEIVSQPEVDIIQMKKGEPFIFTAQVALRPEVELGNYKGVEVSCQDVSVTKKDIDAEIDKLLKSNARIIEVTDRKVETGDTVNIDYEGRVDDVPFEGGKAEGHPLKIGSNAFIPGFEEQIVGHGQQEEFDINVTFPEEYHAKELAGKEAVFTVKINGIKTEELPELDDEFVSDATEFETVDELKKDIKAKTKERKEEEAKNAKKYEAVEKVIADSKMELPEAMINTQVNSMLNEYARGMAGQGLSMQQYFQMTGMNQEQLMEQMRPDAEKQIKTSLVLEEIAKAEKIEISDSDIDDHIEKMVSMYGIGAEELKKNMSDRNIDSIKRELMASRAADLVAENAKEAPKVKKKEKEEVQ